MTFCIYYWHLHRIIVFLGLPSSGLTLSLLLYQPNQSTASFIQIIVELLSYKNFQMKIASSAQLTINDLSVILYKGF